MKKSLFILLFFSTLLASNAIDFRIGLRFAPNLSITSLSYDPNNNDNVNVEFSNSGSTGLRYSFGPIVELGLTENFGIMTGAWFTPKRVAFRSISSDTSSQFDIVYNLQHVRIPMALKMHTNDIILGARLYFTLGGTMDVKVSEKSVEDAGDKLDAYLEDVNKNNFFIPVDFMLLLGTGLEFDLGSSTTVFGGITYNRGLINQINPSLKSLNDSADKLTSELQIRNNLFEIEVGLKF